MRCFGGGFFRCCSCVILAATGTGQDAAPPPALGPAEALNYAQQLLVDVVNPITEHYFRPVSRTELILAGTHGTCTRRRKSPFRRRCPQNLKRPTRENCLALVTQARLSIGNVESLAGTKALRVSIQGVLRKLDPYSGLMSGAELRRGIGISGEYGVGLEMAPGEPGVLIVKSVALGGPAQRAGVRPKDRIVRVGGRPVTPGSSLSNEPAPASDGRSPIRAHAHACFAPVKRSLATSALRSRVIGRNRCWARPVKPTTRGITGSIRNRKLLMLDWRR